MFGFSEKPKPRAAAGPLDKPLFFFLDPHTEKENPSWPWTLRDAFEGTQILGATGSGKTSGSGAAIARAFLSAGFGGLVLTAKEDDLDLWVKTAGELGRSADLTFIGPEHDPCFNFLDHEFQAFEHGRGTKLTQNLVSLFTTALSAGEDRTTSSADPYWEDALRQLLTNAFDLVGMAQRAIRLSDVLRVVLDAPRTRAEALSERWEKNSFCASCLNQAAAALPQGDAERWGDLLLTRDYWLKDFAGLAERTRSVVVNSFTSKATGLLRSPLRRILCTGETTPNATPRASHSGRVIILDFPVKEYGETGRFAQIIYKTVWQRATERRDLTETPSPVFLWADESQYFVTKHDMLFQQTARAKQAATVYLTQSMSNYYAVMGGGSGRATADSLVGNLQTKIFHANGDPITNDWAEGLFGKGILSRQSMSVGGQGGPNISEQQVHDSIVPSREFTMLRKGGSSGRVQAIVFQGGRTWHDNTNSGHVLRTVFLQGPKVRG